MLVRARPAGRQANKPRGSAWAPKPFPQPGTCRHSPRKGVGSAVLRLTDRDQRGHRGFEERTGKAKKKIKKEVLLGQRLTLSQNKHRKDAAEHDLGQNAKTKAVSF